MSRVNIQKVLDRITYKPGVTFIYDFELGAHGYERHWIAITSMVINVDNPTGPKIPLTMQGAIPEMGFDREESFLVWFQFLLQRLEEHEVHEWFKVDSKCFKDPHPERKTA